MDSLTFACPKCDRRMTVGVDFAARPVRCPNCKQVVTAPDAAPELLTETRERPESIFADPGEEDSLFESGRAARVELPPEPPPPPPPDPPPGPWSALSDRPIPPAADPPPFAVPPPPAAAGRNWLLIAVSVYAALATAAAAWGWLRPAGPPPTPSVPVRAAR